MHENQEISLLLPDEVLILALDPEKKAFSDSLNLPIVMAAGHLLELVLLDRLDTDGRASFLIKDSSTSGNQVIDQALKLLANNLKNRFIKYWLSDPAGFVELTHENFDRLLESGLLVREQKRSLLMYPTEEWTWTAEDYLNTILEEFKACSDGIEPCNSRTYCLIKLIRSCPTLISHITDPEDWEGVEEPILGEEGLNVAMIESVCSILRATVTQ